jgi:hypothetical protein
MRRPLALAAGLAIALAASASLQAYLKLGTDTGTSVVAIRWTRQPIQWAVTNRTAAGIAAAQLQGAVERALTTWTSEPGVNLSTSFLGFTSAEPRNGDGLSTIGFQFRPDLDRTLGATSFEVDAVSGEILEADIFFNSNFSWSDSGEASRFDLESIAVHEVGHLFGLGHSALGETELQGGRRRVLGKGAVMFPIAYLPGNLDDRTLEEDDRAGLLDLYGAAARDDHGAIAGRVTLDGQGVFGAHVTAFNTETGALVGTFSLNDRGDFVVAGLSPGIYVIRVEPLDDADLDSFFDDDLPVDVDFRPAFHPRLVAVPPGGAGDPVEIQVQPK